MIVFGLPAGPLRRAGPCGDTARAMSEENVEIVRALFAAWSNGDYSDVNWADAEIEFVIDGPEDSRSKGIEAMGAAWRDFLAGWSEFRGVPEKVIGIGEQVLVINEFAGRGRRSGVPIRGMHGAALFTFELGKVVRLQLFSDREKGLEAAGLRE